MRILVLSWEAWRGDSNGGNVLSNIFDGIDAEYAQVYCSSECPNNKICQLYYQMTDFSVIKNIFTGSPVGRIVTGNCTKATNINSNEKEGHFYSFFKRHRLNIFYSIQGILWNISKWKCHELDDFVLDFHPDIIFAPCYSKSFMLKLTRYIKELTGKSVISYISDDGYTLKQFNLSPFFWINRFSVRKQMRKTFQCYDLVYTMIDDQKKQCEKDFRANMKLLRKSNSFLLKPRTDVNKPIKFVYAGGLYLNRWKVLAALAREINTINQQYGTVFSLDIYTNSEITKLIKKKFAYEYITLHSAINQIELRNVYSESDVALHVESFDLKNRLLVRMSFSTKIVDCLSSGCAVMAICDSKQGGYLYLKDNDAAICIDKIDKIRNYLWMISEHPNMILDYANKASQCCLCNHDKTKTKNMIELDFYQWSNITNE